MRLLLLVLIFVSTLYSYDVEKYIADNYIPVNIHITRVIDGDTVKAVLNGKEVSLRLAAIDTSESFSNYKSKKNTDKCNVPECILLHIGLTSKEYIKTLLTLQEYKVYILATGYYGRNIVWIPNVNIKMIQYGYAQVYRHGRFPHLAKKELYRLEKIARHDKLNMWQHLTKPCF